MSARDASYARVPHFSLPFRFKDSADGVHAVVNDQDTYEEIQDCVSAIVRYDRGSRPEAPQFGITPQEFSIPVNTQQVLEQVQENEPRVQLLVTSQLDAIDQMITHVIIGIAENTDTNATLPTGGTDV
jgi:phage baseplate assembly protein W